VVIQKKKGSKEKLVGGGVVYEKKYVCGFRRGGKNLGVGRGKEKRGIAAFLKNRNGSNITTENANDRSNLLDSNTGTR